MPAAECFSTSKSFFILSVLIVCSLASPAQGFLRTEGQQIVNERGQNVLLRGIGLGGWMLQEGYMLKINKDAQQYRIRERIDSLIGPARTQEFYDAWLSNHTSRADIDSLKKWGFNSVRLPMHYNLFTLPVEQENPVNGQTWLTKGFALTDSLLSWCRSNQMYVILDLHAAPGGQGNDVNIADRDKSKPSLWDSEANQAKTIALWRKLAERYANEPWIAGYDIINEPNWGFDDLANDPNGNKEKHNVPLKKLMVDITRAIREVDKKHIVIIEGNGWGNNYNGILPPWDSNMVLSFHKYWNFNDTASIRHILAARSTYNLPVWLGETGENSNVWFTEAVHLLEAHNIGWAWWPLKKIGSNNPFEIKMNPNYESMVNYFNGRGKRPAAGNAYKGLMELAADLKTGQTIFHKDVIDAMFRQPYSSEAIPFNNITVADKSVLKAVDYDLGKNGVAYFDNDTADYHISNGSRGGNRGRMYRNDGVDIKKDTVGNGGYFVTDIEKGEWLQYTIRVKGKRMYSLTVELASVQKGGKVSLLIDQATVVKSMELATTVGSANWQLLPAGNFTFSEGTHVIRLYAAEAGFNFKSIQFNLK